ncbi:MAG: hypothetical protein AB1801_20655 [Chloroflexota bacterium]
MGKRQISLGFILAGLMTLAILAASTGWFARVAAAPAVELSAATRSQTTATTFASLSSMAFQPVNSTILYHKDARRQLLTRLSQARGETPLFVAPLTLPDRSRLTGLTVFGEDFDNQGAIIIRLLRCDHGQPRCVTLAETTSTDSLAAGQFETLKVSILNEIVDNNFYSYVAELELTAIFNSGLRSVRLETVATGGTAAAAGNVESWSLAGSATSFPLPNLNWTEVRVCTADLSHLNNPTHYPFVVADGQSTQLGSNTCVTVSGQDIKIQRRLNSGPSSGTYQFLR